MKTVGAFVENYYEMCVVLVPYCGYVVIRRGTIVKMYFVFFI
jgi:hypothetical protein